MHKYKPLVIGAVVLFLAAFLLGGKGSEILIFLSVLLIVLFYSQLWHSLLLKEKEMLIKFKIEYDYKTRIKRTRKNLLWVIGFMSLLFVVVYFGMNNGGKILNSTFSFPFIIALNLSNIFLRVMFKDCYLTKEGISRSLSGKSLDIKDYHSYHFEPKYNSFILSKDGVETMELVAKTPIKPYEIVLINWFENQLYKSKPSDNSNLSDSKTIMD